MDGRRMFRICMVLLITLSLTASASAESFDEVVLSRLGVAEILTFLDAWTHEEGLSDAALAAKYIWGYVPPDRKPDLSLTTYWGSLPFSEQRRIKIRWYREHYYELSVDQVSKYVDIEYLIKQVKDEYRETPFETSRKIPQLAVNPGVAGAFVKTSPDKEKKIQQAAANAKKKMGAAKASPSDTGALKPAKASAKADTAPVKPADAAKPGKPSATPAEMLDKLPWHGLPSTLRNK